MSRVFVLGNASIDVTLRVPRLPLQGETLMAHGIARAPGGKGLNQAVAAARAGAEVHFCAAIGREPEVDIIRSALRGEALAVLRLLDAGAPTDLSTLLVAPDGANCIISTGDCAAALAMADACDFLAAMRGDDILLMQGNLSAAVTAAALARARRAIINTAPIRWPMAAMLRGVGIAVANEVEAAALTGTDDPMDAALRLGARVGIVTLGAQGCVVAAGGAVTHTPAVSAVAVDTTGAGDVFCGVLAAGLARGCDLPGAVAIAQHAAAHAVARAGCFAAIPSPATLLPLFDQYVCLPPTRP